VAKINPIYGNGAWPIDNNAAENAILPMVVGRKNLLFSVTGKGAKASANLYSLVETAKANNVEPSVYLKEVFTRLPAAICVEDIEALLPWNIAKVVFRLLRFNKNLVTKSQLLKS
jgi:transposase